MKRLLISFFLSCVTSAFALNPGDKAPNFKLKNQKGEMVEFKELNKDKIVVLEWYNHGCPFVRKHYDSQNMQKIQKVFKDNDYVTWLTIVSSNKGKQGFIKTAGAAKEKMQEEKSGADHLLLDFDGAVGKAFEAKTTPHMFVVDNFGIIRYVGAIDSVASANPADIGRAKNYITSAVSKVLLKQKPNPSKTKPYGCSVKY